MLHLGYERICYVWVMEGQVTFGLQKDMLLLDYGRTCYIWVTEGHVTFGVQKDVLHPFMTVTIPSCPHGLHFQGALAT